MYYDIVLCCRNVEYSLLNSGVFKTLKHIILNCPRSFEFGLLIFVYGDMADNINTNNHIVSDRHEMVNCCMIVIQHSQQTSVMYA
jgi:hypothetical protein